MPFTPIHATLGGLSLGLSVFWNARLTGRVTGLSGMVRSALTTLRPSAAFYLLGLCLSAPLLRELLPPSADTLAAISPPHLAVSGALVGLGTTLANGCTSGHALCGVARLSRRSITAALVFMGVAVFVASLMSTSRLYPSSPAVLSAPKLPTQHEVPFITAALLVALLLPPWLAGLQARIDKPKVTSRVLAHALQVALGFSFGAGLIISGMALPSKVAAFLDFTGPSWDPSLLFVFVGALPLAHSAFRPLLHGAKPLLAAHHAIPTNSVITPRLVLGSALFGLGWGAVGLCPGPAIVYLGGFPTSAGLAAFGVGLFGGMSLGTRM